MLTSVPAPPEASRARQPDATGVVERDGVRVAWERHGEGSPTILLMPTWSIFPSRHWKFQVPYLARHFRVVSFGAAADPIGPLNRTLMPTPSSQPTPRPSSTPPTPIAPSSWACRWAAGTASDSPSISPIGRSASS
jgi:hypothetical protein